MGTLKRPIGMCNKMANFFNIFAGLMTFVMSSVMAYALWNPAMEIFNFFPTELFVIVGSMYAMLHIYAICYMPFIMMVSDDKGN